MQQNADNTLHSDYIILNLSMSCETFWEYELELSIDPTLFSTKYTNLTEHQAFTTLSHFICLQIKTHIHFSLLQNGQHDLLAKLDTLFPTFHIHGLSSHEILYPNDPTNSDHCRADGKIFICTHC